MVGPQVRCHLSVLRLRHLCYSIPDFDSTDCKAGAQALTIIEGQNPVAVSARFLIREIGTLRSSFVA